LQIETDNNALMDACILVAFSGTSLISSQIINYYTKEILSTLNINSHKLETKGRLEWQVILTDYYLNKDEYTKGKLIGYQVATIQLMMNELGIDESYVLIYGSKSTKPIRNVFFQLLGALSYSFGHTKTKEIIYRLNLFTVIDKIKAKAL